MGFHRSSEKIRWRKAGGDFEGIANCKKERQSVRQREQQGVIRISNSKRMKESCLLFCCGGPGAGESMEVNGSLRDAYSVYKITRGNLRRDISYIRNWDP